MTGDLWSDDKFTEAANKGESPIEEPTRQRISKVLSNLSLENKAILDVCAGAGTQHYFSSEVLPNITALDGSTTLLENNQSGHKIHGDINKPFPAELKNDSFDITTSMFGIRYVGEQENPDKTLELRTQFLNELIRVTKSGGVIEIIDYTFCYHPTEIPFEPEEMEKLLQIVTEANTTLELNLETEEIVGELFFPDFGAEEGGMLISGPIYSYKISVQKN